MHIQVSSCNVFQLLFCGIRKYYVRSNTVKLKTRTGSSLSMHRHQHMHGEHVEKTQTGRQALPVGMNVGFRSKQKKQMETRAQHLVEKIQAGRPSQSSLWERTLVFGQSTAHSRSSATTPMHRSGWCR